MNWYKKAQQQYLWDNDPDLRYANDVFESTGDLEEDIEESKDANDLQKVLRYHQIPYNAITFPNKVILWILDYKGEQYILEPTFPYPNFEKVEDWIDGLGDYVYEYIEERDFQKEFWDSVEPGQVVYHGTEESNLDSILNEGLEPKNKTRGISNRSTGAAVFTSDVPPIAGYEKVLAVNIGQMKADGNFIYVGKEEPLEESDAKEALAHKLGIKNYYAESYSSDGLDHGTVIFYGSIHPKYVQVYE